MTCRAAELRAAAAERRLAALANPKLETLETASNDDEDEKGFNFDTDDDVPDPHINPTERKRQMEEDMTDDERNGLRGGWEAFVTKQDVSGSNPSTAKRKVSAEVVDVKGLKKRGVIDARNAPKFNSEAVKEEEKRGLGLASTSRQSGGRRLGGSI